ncbi:MAG: 1-acyl-sn-glycerol-3-phosphate acyltransferase, partial [Armatimonadetes bacterium]|nr:1-acyl-sn-glycerol-3-phosphate acyltransferase [Armatimonadota bacterium]
MPLAQPWSLAEQATVDIGRILFGGFFRLRVEGLQHLPRRGGCLIVCNHPTLIDPVLLTLAMPRSVSHMAASTPWRYEPIGYFLDLFRVIPMVPGEPAAPMQQAMVALDEGRLVMIFPEGNLSPAGELGRFHPGAAMLALAARCPVVPAAICGSHAAWPKGRAFPRFKPVTVRLGPPLALAQAYSRRSNARLVRAL